MGFVIKTFGGCAIVGGEKLTAALLATSRNCIGDCTRMDWYIGDLEGEMWRGICMVAGKNCCNGIVAGLYWPIIDDAICE